MTVDEVKARVSAVDKASWDEEDAHAKEDEVYKDVLRAIAAGAPNAAALAAEAIKAADLDFARWYA